MLFKTFRTIPERRGLPLLLPISTLRKTKDLSFPRAEHSFILLLPLCRKHAHVVSKQTNEKRAVGSSHPQANKNERWGVRVRRRNGGSHRYFCTTPHGRQRVHATPLRCDCHVTRRGF